MRENKRIYNYNETLYINENKVNQGFTLKYRKPFTRVVYPS